MKAIRHKFLEIVLAPEDQGIVVKNPVSGNKKKCLRNAGVLAPAGKLRRSMRGLQGSLIWPSYEGRKHAAVWCPPHAGNWSQGLMPSKRCATWATPQHVWYNSFSSVTSRNDGEGPSGIREQLGCLHEPTRTQQPLSQRSFNFILAEGGRARFVSSEKGTWRIGRSYRTKAGHRVMASS